MTVIRFTVPGKPVSTNQGYRHSLHRGRPSTRLSPEAQDFKARITRAARRAHQLAGNADPIEEHAVVGVRFTFPTLGSDLDGPVKFVLDAIASGSRGHPGARLVVNDTRVRRLVVTKADCDGAPRTEVAVTTTSERGCPMCGCLCGRLLP